MNSNNDVADRRKIENSLTIEDHKALKVIKWLFDQKDLKNGYYFLNQLARQLMISENLKGVRYLLKQFKNVGESDPASREIQTFI